MISYIRSDLLKCLIFLLSSPRPFNSHSTLKTINPAAYPATRTHLPLSSSLNHRTSSNQDFLHAADWIPSDTTNFPRHARPQFASDRRSTAWDAILGRHSNRVTSPLNRYRGALWWWRVVQSYRAVGVENTQASLSKVSGVEQGSWPGKLATKNSKREANSRRNRFVQWPSGEAQYLEGQRPAHLDIDLQFRRQLHEAQNMFV